MKEYDVIVMGAGLTGLMAAAAAAKRGKKVMLMAKGTGAVAFGSGTVDMLGYLPDHTMVTSFNDGIARLPEAHPYTKLGAAKVAEAAKFLADICKEEGYEYAGGLTENSFVPTAAGTLKPTGLIPKTMDAAAVKTASQVLIVGFDKLKDYYPQVIAKGLSRFEGYDKQYESAIVEVKQEEGGRDLNALDIARWLDTPEGRREFINQVKGKVKTGTVVLVPPVLGSKPNYQVADEIQRALNCKVVEMLGMPPGVTGYRLRALLFNYIKKLGVAVAEQVTVTGSKMENGVCKGVVITSIDRERTFYAKSFVLATGGFFGGGLLSGVGYAKEPIFDFALDAVLDQGEWGKLKLFAEDGQPYAQIGVRTNTNLQPITADGQVVATNVYVAGRNLSGYDYCLEKSGNGVAMASGYHAGMLV